MTCHVRFQWVNCGVAAAKKLFHKTKHFETDCRVVSNFYRSESYMISHYFPNPVTQSFHKFIVLNSNYNSINFFLVEANRSALPNI